MSYNNEIDMQIDCRDCAKEANLALCNSCLEKIEEEGSAKGFEEGKIEGQGEAQSECEQKHV